MNMFFFSNAMRNLRLIRVIYIGFEKVELFDLFFNPTSGAQEILI